jgi:phosphatidyl-myo-inositol dimannoside synthase
MSSLLVTNDFPPKVGGIQSYLYELWRRLPPGETTCLTTPFAGDHAWDREQEFRVVRTRETFLLPTRALRRRVDALADEIGADVVFLDPMLPLGLIGPRLRGERPYVVIAHGAEVAVYGRLPASGALGRQVLRGAAGVVAAGQHAAEIVERVAGRPVPTLVVPPGVDPKRFHPSGDDDRRATRQRFGLDPDAPLVLGVSRLVPRKGFDVLIDAVSGIDGAHVAIAGAGRDLARLERRARPLGGRAHFLGRVHDDDLPALFAAADVFAMVCRERWSGLETEGFGIVFLEAAACGVPAVAGRSGGAEEAVVDDETGFVVEPRDVRGLRDTLGRLLGDNALRARLGARARRRAEYQFSHDHLSTQLVALAGGDFGVFDEQS